MEIRLARPEEAPVIWHIRNAAIRHGCRGVYSDEVIAAWTPETMPQGQGHGLATCILHTLKQEALRRGVSRLTLAATHNACNFYQKRGFAVVQESVYHSKLAGADLRCIDMVYHASGE